MASSSHKPENLPKSEETTAAQPASLPSPRFAYPEYLNIYHAGTGRAIFLSVLKLTTIFVFVFFCIVAAPSYIIANEPLYKTAWVVGCGVIPITYVVYCTSPFVTSIRVRLPPFARGSAEALKRFARGAPPTTPLDVSTLSFIGKPRVSSVTLGELRPVRRRFGLVNYSRDTAAINAKRKWWRFRAVREFNIQTGNDARTKAGWVWRDFAGALEKRNQEKKTTA